MPGTDAIAVGGLAGILATMTALFVRSLFSGAAATAARYESELQRTREDRDRQVAALQAEAEFWRKKALGNGVPL